MTMKYVDTMKSSLKCLAAQVPAGALEFQRRTFENFPTTVGYYVHFASVLTPY